jgi:cytochrome c oxidase cbb3-type subunit III
VSRWILLVAALTLVGCPREKREFQSAAPAASRPVRVRVTSLQPGQPLPERVQVPEDTAYEVNAYQLNEGKRLFEWYNCAGCHGHGGGGMGPPLMDDEWIYGHEPQNIYDTIVSGRPNGMPSFGGHISNDHVLKLVAYVRSLGQLTGKSASPGRSDNLYPGESEMKREGKEEPGRARAEHPG